MRVLDKLYLIILFEDRSIIENSDSCCVVHLARVEQWRLNSYCKSSVPIAHSNAGLWRRRELSFA